MPRRLALLLVALTGLVPAPARAQPHVVGAGRCASVACHGRVEPLPAPASPILANEHATWIASDPHAQAYVVLFDPRSVRIAAALAAPGSSPRPAHDDPRCLACHSTPQPIAVLHARNPVVADGVACEACHGPASEWLAPHTTAAWKALAPTEKQARYGFTDLSRLDRRAALCASCHVGRRNDPAGLADRDVNHDLIAAGHPRLAFEFAAYQDNQPPHWAADPPRDAPDGPARAWLLGQLATARISLELLSDRARDPRAPWPEFAEYGCFSCHQDLRGDAPSDDLAAPDHPSTWASWPLALTGDLLADPAATPPATRAAVAPTVAATRQAMARMGSNRQAAASAADRAATALGPWIDQVATAPLPPDLFTRLIAGWDRPPQPPPPALWDQSAQRFLALVPLAASLHRADPAAVPPDLPDRLESLRRALEFPDGYDSPAPTRRSPTP